MKHLVIALSGLYLLFYVSCNAFIKTESSSFSAAYVDLKVLYLFVLQNDPDYLIYSKDFAISGNVESLDGYPEEIKRSIALKVEDAVRYIASENNFELVIEKSRGIIYADKRLDITQSVLNELRLRYNRRSLESR